MLYKTQCDIEMLIIQLKKPVEVGAAFKSASKSKCLLVLLSAKPYAQEFSSLSSQLISIVMTVPFQVDFLAGKQFFVRRHHITIL